MSEFETTMVELTNIAHKIRKELDNLDQIDRDLTRKRIIADFTKILNSPVELDDLKWKAFNDRVQKT